MLKKYLNLHILLLVLLLLYALVFSNAVTGFLSSVQFIVLFFSGAALARRMVLQYEGGCLGKAIQFYTTAIACAFIPIIIHNIANYYALFGKKLENPVAPDQIINYPDYYYFTFENPIYRPEKISSHTTVIGGRTTHYFVCPIVSSLEEPVRVWAICDSPDDPQIRQGYHEAIRVLERNEEYLLAAKQCDLPMAKGALFVVEMTDDKHFLRNKWKMVLFLALLAIVVLIVAEYIAKTSLKSKKNGDGVSLN
jgi:hypothetical protein